ncbi:hypothetical protein D3C72_2065630 [compost metagenome]
MVEHDDSILAQAHYKTITGNFLGGLAEEHTSDILPVTRSLIRHDAKRVVKTLLKEYERSKRS